MKVFASLFQSFRSDPLSVVESIPVIGPALGGFRMIGQLFKGLVTKEKNPLNGRASAEKPFEAPVPAKPTVLDQAPVGRSWGPRRSIPIEVQPSLYWCLLPSNTPS